MMWIARWNRTDSSLFQQSTMWGRDLCRPTDRGRLLFDAASWYERARSCQADRRGTEHEDEGKPLARKARRSVDFVETNETRSCKGQQIRVLSRINFRTRPVEAERLTSTAEKGSDGVYATHGTLICALSITNSIFASSTSNQYLTSEIHSTMRYRSTLLPSTRVCLGIVESRNFLCRVRIWCVSVSST